MHILLYIREKMALVSIVVLGAFLFGSPSGAHGQEIAVDGDSSQSTTEFVVTSTTNIYNVEIVKQENHEVTLSFDIFNEIGVQPQVKYYIELLDPNPSLGDTVVDTQTYDEVLALGEGETLSRTIVYNAPTFLNGTYEIMIYVQNTNGFLMAFGSPGLASFESTEGIISFDFPSCQLFVTDPDQTDGSNLSFYLLRSGVDIDPSHEELHFSCPVENRYSETVNVVPYVETYHRSLTGERVAREVLKDVSIQLLPGETDVISFALPVVEMPQAYDFLLTLRDYESGASKSGSVNGHYVIRGETGTIQNVWTEKPSYVAGEQAKVHFFWSMASDAFVGARGGMLGSTPQDENPLVRIHLVDGMGESCSAIQESVLTGDVPIVERELLVERDCQDVVVEAELLNGDKEILDSQKFALTNYEPTEEAPEESKEDSYTLVAMIFAICSIFLVLLLYYMSKGGNIKRGTSLRSFIVLGSVLLLSLSVFVGGASTASAAGFYLGERNLIGVNFVFNTDKASYREGESILARGRSYPLGCRNMALDFDLKSTYETNTKVHAEYSFDSVDSHTLMYEDLLPNGIRATTRSYIANQNNYIDFLGSVRIEDDRTYIDENDDEVSDWGTRMFTATRRVFFDVIGSGSLGYECTGGEPINSDMCMGDSLDLVEDVPRLLGDSCTAGRKCEYVCLPGYERVGNECIQFVCIGTIPEHSRLCVGDDWGLTEATNYTLVDSRQIGEYWQGSCTGARKCEVYCENGYVKAENKCIPESSAPEPITIHQDSCSGSENNVVLDEGESVEIVACQGQIDVTNLVEWSEEIPSGGYISLFGSGSLRTVEAILSGGQEEVQAKAGTGSTVGASDGSMMFTVDPTSFPPLGGDSDLTPPRDLPQWIEVLP